VPDLNVYISMILSDAFLKRNEPAQALFRLESVKHNELLPNIEAWYAEYLATSLAGYLQKQLDEGHFKKVISEYEKRHTKYFLKKVRPEVLFRVVSAYEKLGLYGLAEKVFVEASRSKEILGKNEARPYDTPEEQWKWMQAHLAIESIENSRDPDKLVKNKLTQLNSALVENIRLWIKYAAKIADLKLEGQWWIRLDQKTALNFDEVRRYSFVLDKLSKSVEQIALLEKSVGVWMSDRKIASEVPMKPTDLLLRLAELKSKNTNDRARADLIYQYLLTLEPTEFYPPSSKPMVAYKRGMMMQENRRFEEARQSFGLAKRLEPDSLWAQLSANAEKEIPPSR
jgi:tetratricopeptide (TPR) repeat protein